MVSHPSYPRLDRRYISGELLGTTGVNRRGGRDVAQVTVVDSPTIIESQSPMPEPESPTKADPPDDTEVGNWTIRRAKYLHVQTALRSLHGKLSGCNTTATMHGALVAPYIASVL